MNTATSETDYGVATAPDTVRIERLLPGPIERVWAYLTESELRRQWLAAGEMEMQVGSTFELVWRNDELTEPPGRRPAGFDDDEYRMQSRITVLEPPRRLAFTWSEGEAGMNVGDVSFELQPKGDKVLLTLTHRGLVERTNKLMVGAGWHTHLDVLAARAKGETPEPFWDRWSRLREEYDRRMPG
ncbi:SRPBCC family protein [Luteimonas suaedae]|uniref:SRPBCC family protein n=1 Tax=Luteimonas suaedae TaxID=2605430 RepID=UPI0011ED431D|nr:SRPBCC family protein [Luteimonas suaedae]